MDGPGGPAGLEARRSARTGALIFGPVAVIVLALIAVAGSSLRVPRLPWSLTVAALAIFGATYARARNGPNTVTLWWAVTSVLAGAWLGWSRFEPIRLSALWLLLAVLAIALLFSYPRVYTAHAERLAEADRRAAEAARTAQELAVRNYWPRLLERIGHPGVKIVNRRETASGYVLSLRLPSSGQVTITKLRHDLERLEVAADARRGSLQLEGGDTARDVLLHVTERDFLAETIPYEDDGQTLSIQNPIPIGRYEDGRICELTLREIAVLIVGLRGSGKSNLLNVLIAQLVRCVDVLVFCIDMKYRLAMPWVTPYLNDERNGMAVDWAATTRREAEAVLKAFVRGIHARAAAGVGEEKIEPDTDQPAVFLVIDEIASIFGTGTGLLTSEGPTNTTLAGLGTDAVRLGRSEAMDLIAASQRGSTTMLGSGDFKSQFPLRIGLTVQNENEALSVIPDDQEAARILASLKHEGTGLVQWREGRMMRVKFFRITPGQVSDIARQYGPGKPRPEPVLARALGPDYVTRWERFRSSGKAAMPAVAPGRENPTDRQFQEITARLPDLADVPRSGGALRRQVRDDSALRQRMRDYIARSPNPVTISMIVRLLDSPQAPVDEATVQRWLEEDIDRSLVERSAPGRYRLRGDDGR